MNNITSRIPFISSYIEEPSAEERERGVNKYPLRDQWLSFYGRDFNKDTYSIETFEKISKELLKLGFNHRLISHSYLKYKYQDTEQALEILRKVNNLWVHDFVESDFNKCFICDEEKSAHRDLNSLQEKIILEKKESISDHKIQQEVEKLKKKTSVSVDLIGLDIKEKGNNASVLKISVKDCPICWAEMTEGNKVTITVECKHEFCKDCILDYIKEEIPNSFVKVLKCPDKGCPELFPEALLESFATKEQFEKYLKFKERKRINEDPSLVSCPYVNCESYAVKPAPPDDSSLMLMNDPSAIEKLLNNENEPKIKLICNKNHAFCSLCLKAWHEDTTCKEDEEVAKYATESGYILKKCPQCKVWTEKNEGCNHMTCKLCKFEWCWLCNLKCEPDHYLIEGTPCFNRQFDEPASEEELYLMQMLQNMNTYMNSYLFVWIIPLVLISVIFSRLYRVDPNNPNRAVPGKCIIYTILVILELIIFLLGTLTNWILILYMVVHKSKIGELDNSIFWCTLGFSYAIIWFVFYFFGVILSIIWFAIVFLFTTVKIIIA